MKSVLATIALALAFAAVPSASFGQKAPSAAIGVAFYTQYNRVNVAEVMPGGTGDLMGIRAGDVITHAGGKRIDVEAKLTAYIRTLKVGDPVELTVKRNRDKLQLKGTAMARRW